MKRHWKRGKMEERKNNWERKEKDLGEKKREFTVTRWMEE